MMSEDSAMLSTRESSHRLGGVLSHSLDAPGLIYLHKPRSCTMAGKAITKLGQLSGGNVEGSVASHSPYSGTARLNCCSSHVISSCVRLMCHQYTN